MSALPEPGARWVARRKAAVVAAIDAGVISAEAACARYGLSAEELAGWQARAARGEHALMVKLTRAPGLHDGSVTISDDSDDRIVKRERVRNAQAQQSSLSSLIVTGAAPWAKRESVESDDSDDHRPRIAPVRARAFALSPAFICHFVTVVTGHL